MARDLKPLPKNQSQVVQEAFVPYINKVSKTPADTVFSKNRGREISFKDKSVKDFSVSLKDHDEVIKYYFENTIKPSVIQNGSRLPVPIIYGSPERWKSVQADGVYRDKDGKIMAPIIMYKRDTLEKNRNLGNKLDGNKVHNYQVFEQRFNPKNQYDKFSILTNRQPSKEVYMSVIPDYVTLTYSCAIFTDYMEQINPIIEAINFASDSYWGDFSRFKFRARIDSFTNTTEVNTTDGRTVRTNFNIVLQGYIIPDVINKQIANADIYYSTSQLVFNFETTTDDLTGQDISTLSALTMGSTNSTTIFEGGSNVTINTSIASDQLAYINRSVVKVANSVTTNTATFLAEFLQAPLAASFPPTSKDNFTFYINGIYIRFSIVTDFIDNGDGTCTVTFDTDALGYSLETSDEVIAIGKFA
jgi:hypothetical protein